MDGSQLYKQIMQQEEYTGGVSTSKVFNIR